jgi:hypothetical protein
MSWLGLTGFKELDGTFSAADFGAVASGAGIEERARVV